LPAGNDPLPTGTWQPVPGAPGFRIYPLIRKPDTICSNAYLLDAPDAIILIDPGGLPEQATLMAHIITEIRAESKRPVFVILTHAHIDHFIGAMQVPSFCDPAVTVFVAQETGADALGTGDCRLTQAEFFSRTYPPFSPGIRLFAAGSHSGDREYGTVMCTNDAQVAVTARDSGTGLATEAIRFGPDTELAIYHTPGHSPDSICIRAGSLLFIGDILFAASPGVAGLSGWNQQELVRSLDGIRAIIDGGGIDLVCPGHGRILAAADAARMLSAVRNDALALENIAELNKERSDEAAEYAGDCMEQVDELFTIIAGRLSYVAYVMEELGEDGIAGNAGGLISGETIDELLEAFRTFARQHHETGNVSIHLALKAGQIVGKLERTFKKEELADVIDPSLVNRAGRLLSDYTIMLRGFNPPSELAECDIAAFTEEIIAGLARQKCADEDLLSASEDDDMFSKMLLKRIGTRPLLEDVDLTFSRCGETLVTEIDRDDFTDLVTYILEDLVGSGAARVRVQVGCSGETASVTFSGTGCAEAAGPISARGGFLARLCRRAGGSLVCGDQGNIRSYVISLPVSR
jgi:glyoxylase-like metal-dependent hydrolase (beta-lactamase superfamily II)